MVTTPKCAYCGKKLSGIVEIVYINGEKIFLHAPENSDCSEKYIRKNAGQLERVEFIPINELDSFLERDDFYLFVD